MKMNSEELYTLMNDFQTSDYTKVDFTVRNQDTGEEEEIENFVPFNYFKRYFTRKYGSWLYLYPDVTIDTSNTAFDSFINDWRYYVLNVANKENWAKLWETYFYKFNPIENYDRKTSISTEYMGKEKNSTDYKGSEKNITSFYGSEMTTNSTPENGYTDTSTSLRSPEDSSLYVPVDKVETHISSRADTSKLEFSEGRENANTREFDERNDTTEKSFENRKDEVTEHTHGNIGVSTVGDMSMKTLEMVKVNIINKILDDFVNEHCIFWG